MVGKEQAFDIMNKIAQNSRADQTEISLMGFDHFLTRFANSQIHQNTAVENYTVTIKAVVGKKIGVSSVNSLDPFQLAKATQSAYETALLQREIPDFTGLPYPAPLKEVWDSFVPRTAEIVAEEKALIIQDMIGRSVGDSVVLHGGFYTGYAETAILNTNGVQAYHTDTRANLAVTASAPDTNGYASASHRDVDKIDHTTLIEEALESAKKYGKTIDIEPGEYPVILEEYAISEMLIYLSDSFSFNSVDEGSSFITAHKNQQLFPEYIALYDDPMNPGNFATPFDYEGLPVKRLDFIKKGVVTGNYTHNSYTAGKTGVQSTGHALPSGYGVSSTGPLHIFMDPGDKSYQELQEMMDEGLLIKRFHYLTTVHPLKTILSGMTRDGVFLIKKGKITARVSNMRFTQSIIDALKHVRAMSKETKLTWFRDFTLDLPLCTVVPRLLIDKFNFTGKTEFQ